MYGAIFCQTVRLTYLPLSVGDFREQTKAGVLFLSVVNSDEPIMEFNIEYDCEWCLR